MSCAADMRAIFTVTAPSGLVCQCLPMVPQANRSNSDVQMSLFQSTLPLESLAGRKYNEPRQFLFI
jgi:hypothetical protein